jgi:1-aminocyclopropane-1-carboxylate deaminase/D-cysteine desulfhydrase-like pyridoxal-dependent ACC family enzyme
MNQTMTTIENASKPYALAFMKFKPTTDNEYHFGGYGKVNQELALSISF